MDQKNNNTVGKRIQTIITENHIKKSEFAHSVGVSPNYIYQLLSEKKTGISPTLAKLIESIYGYSAKWILEGDSIDDVKNQQIRSAALEYISKLSTKELVEIQEFIKKIK